tara:strand:+ start:1329 stop:2996 length:1668 start_codon:yes stop_codon:yes gene_type:complete
MAMEDYLKNSQFSQVAGSILSRKDDDYKKDALKALTLDSILQVFDQWKNKRKDTVSKNTEMAAENEIVALGKDKAYWDRRNEILAQEKKIQENGSSDVFFGRAENWFNNPENQTNIPNFRAEDFEDSNSPMYKVKNKRIQQYIKEVLVPAHNSKMEKIDKNILTFDEFTGKTRTRFDKEEKYINRPTEKSLIKKGLSKIGLFTEQDNILENEYETARLESEALRRTRGQIFTFDETKIDDIKTTDPLGNIKYRNPYEGLTQEELLAGNVFTLAEFKGSDQFKTLQTVSQQLDAVKQFNANENFGDVNNQEAITAIVMTAKVVDLEEQRISTFDAIKNNDSDFIKTKPKRNETLAEYNKREDVIAWKVSLDEAYSAEKQTAKYLKARRDAGYDIGAVGEQSLEVEELIDFDTELAAKHLKIGLVVDGKKYTTTDYSKDREELKNTLLEKFVKGKLSVPSNFEAALQTVYLNNVKSLSDWMVSAEGVSYVKNKRIQLQSMAKEGVVVTEDEVRSQVRRAKTNVLTKGYMWNINNMVLLPSGGVSISETNDLILDTLN